EGSPSLRKDKAGAVIAVVSSFRDVSDQVAAEQALEESEVLYRLIAENVRDVVVQIDTAGILRYVSPSCRAFGYDPEELISTLGFDLVHPDDRGRVIENTREVISGVIDPSRNRRARLRTKNGAYRWYEGNPSRITDASGAVTGI